jgi:histidinol phosphatase-like PHP family hydrolase
MSPPAGTRFYRADLHIHTPASADFTDKKASPEDVIAACLRASLDIVAITDHNDVAWLPRIRAAAASSQLVVFPGFEVNAQGGHILAIFDPSAPQPDLETALIECGIPKKSWGNRDAIGHDIPTALRAISGNGGLAIAAHADAPKGFLAAIQQGATRQLIYADERLSAIELTSLARRDEYIAGAVPGYPRPMACLQGSDAHSLAEIGSRTVNLRVHRATIEGLRQALNEPVLRVRFPDQSIEITYPYVESLHVDTGFLAGQEIPLNPSLNCLIGGAGTGKSTIIEFLRFGLDQMSQVDHIAADCRGKLTDLAGIGATVSIVIVSESGERYEIQRTFDDMTNPHQVVHLSDGASVDVPDLRSFFPVHAFSQGEVVGISRSPLAQLALLDAHLDISAYQARVGDAYAALAKQTEGIVKLEAVARDRPAVEREIASHEAQVKLLSDELHKLQEAQKHRAALTHQLWIAEEAYFAELMDAITATRISIEEGIDAMELPMLQTSLPEEETPNKPLLKKVASSATSISGARTKAKTALLSALADIEREVHDHRGTWAAAFKAHSQEYEALSIIKKTTRIAQLNAQLVALRKKIQAARTKFRSIEAAKATLAKQLKERAKHLASISDGKARIRTLRERKARDFAKQIGDRISLKLVADGNTAHYEEVLVRVMKGSHAPRTVSHLVATTIHPVELAGLLRKKDANEIDRLSQIGAGWAKALVDRVEANSQFLYEIEAAPVEDLLEIGFKVGEGKYRQLEKLSTGQKATVIVLLTMVEGTNPVIFDQPEDALYTPFIYTDVVKTLRRGKDRRQFILATHNPNIAVGADVDLGIVLEGTATESAVQSAGGLDDDKTRGLMLWHLEGGETALRSRHVKFGLR